MKTIFYFSEEEKKDEPLIIPLLGSKTWHDRIVNKIDADIFLPKADKEKVGDASVNEAKSKLSNGKTSPIISIKKEPVEDSENKVVTLEEQATKEIIEELKSKNKYETKTNDLTLPLVEDESLRGKEQVRYQHIDVQCTDVLHLHIINIVLYFSVYVRRL